MDEISIALVLICVLAVNQFMLFILIGRFKRKFEEYKVFVFEEFSNESENVHQNLDYYNRQIRLLHREFYGTNNKLKKNSKTVNIDTQEVKNDE